MNNEKVLLELKVRYKNTNDIKLKLTKENIYFEKLKGLFKKQYKVIDSIPMNIIEVSNNKVVMNVRKEVVSIETTKGTYNITCKSVIDARKLSDKVTNIKTDSTSIIRLTNNVKKVAAVVGGTAAAIGTAAVSISKNKEKVLEAVNAIKYFVKR